jgi:hypothetical protein
VGHASSSGVVVMWSRGCARPPSLGVEACGVDFMADRWAWSPLSARAALVASGCGLFMTLDMPRTIPCSVHEWPPLCLSIV